MSVKSDFEKLQSLYSAIIDLNKVLEDKTSDTRFDDAINCIKEINKSDFDKSIEEDIIVSIKNAVLKIYNDESERLNKALTDPSKLPPVDIDDFYPGSLVKKDSTPKSPLLVKDKHVKVDYPITEGQKVKAVCDSIELI